MLGSTEITTPTSITGGLGLRPRGGLPKGAELSDPFAYISRPGAKPVSRLDLLLASPRPVPAWRQQVFRSYGGFDVRRSVRPGTEAATALNRRYALIGAEAINSPVIRANWLSGFTSRVRLELERTPFDDQEDTREPDPPPAEEIAVPLEDKLREDVQTTADRLREEAWDAFKDGSYRRAARAFGSMLSVEEDLDARIGELFSHYALGAMNTAVADVHQLHRRSDNPFSAALSMPEKFRRLDDVTRSKIQARLDAASAASSPDTAALAIFVLWYLDDREEAQAAATRLSRHSEAGMYAAWPVLMRSVSRTEPTEAPRG